MKQYRHRVTGEMWDGKSVVVEKRGRKWQVFNPNEETLALAGYEVYEAPVVEVVEPSAEELARRENRRRMREIEGELRGLDYLTSKEVDGEDMSAYDERYGGDWKAYRRGLREEYREIEDGLNGVNGNDGVDEG